MSELVTAAPAGESGSGAVETSTLYSVPPPPASSQARRTLSVVVSVNCRPEGKAASVEVPVAAV